MDTHQKVLFVDAGTTYYRIKKYAVGQPFYGPVDLGLHLAGHFDSLNFGVGLLAGSVLPGSNRLVVTGFSPCWGGFYVSTMGGAALVFENLGLNMLSVVGRAATPSVLYLNRRGGEHVEVEVVPLDVHSVWREDPGGVYSLMNHVFQRYRERYSTDPRVLAVGPAAEATDIGAIGSAPITDGKITHADTWSGRGGFGSKLLQQHNLAAIIFGGTFVDQDLRDRKVVDQWFEDRFNQRMKAVDFEATTKYRFDPQFQTGGTFGVNFASMAGRMIYFNYRSIYDDESQRLAVHDNLVVKHYLRQFNEETIQPKQQTVCGEPCVAVCKKMQGEHKKDYEPYQAMGPLSGIFDQRAAERLTRRADTYGFDAISIGGVIAWLLECLSEGLLEPAELGAPDRAMFTPQGFDVVADSAHNADIGIAILDSIIQRRGILDLRGGARKFARKLSREKGKAILDRFVYAAFGRNGWMVPNQYWTPGVLSPMAVMGKYYMYYGNDFLPPRTLGRMNAAMMKNELLLDNSGFCRFHRAWAEDMLPEIVDSLYGTKEGYLQQIANTASRMNSRNASVFWESERNIDYVHSFLKRKREIDGERRPELEDWIQRFDSDRNEAALGFWCEIQKGVMESLREL